MLSFRQELNAIVRQFDLAKIRFALCGGLAASIYSEPRGWFCYDFVVEPSNVDLAISSLAAIDFFEASSCTQNQILIRSFVKNDPGHHENLKLDLWIPDPTVYSEVWIGWNSPEMDGQLIHIVSEPSLVRMGRAVGGLKRLAEIAGLESAP
jgi:hypothetical protein